MADSCETIDHPCLICLGTNNPITLQCGHSFCVDCVHNYWDQEDDGGVCSCLLCRKIFTPRRVSKRNGVLVEFDFLRNTSTAKQSPPPDEDGASPAAVKCDFCTEKKLVAVKSCVRCLASYCAVHLQPHYQSAAFKHHTLVEAFAHLQEKICSKHEKLLEVYCRRDSQCICLLCVMDEHKGHDVVSAATERKDRQERLGPKKQIYQDRINQKEEQLQKIRLKLKTLQGCVEAAVDQNQQACAKIILIMDKRRSAVDELLRIQRKAAESQAGAVVEQLEKEISELRKEEDGLQRLSLTNDDILFLQGCRSVLESPDHDVSPGFNIHEPFEFLRTSISELRSNMEKMAKTVGELSDEFQLEPDPKTRQDFLLYFCPLTLDPSTVSEHLLLSEGNQKVGWDEKTPKNKVSWIEKAPKSLEHYQRFTGKDQVLCAEGLSGVCYWEVEWQGPRVEVAVCYKGADLGKGSFGHTEHAWCLSLSNAGCTFWHSETGTKIASPGSSILGVYLNHPGGRLSFYSVSSSGQMMLLHRVQTPFTQPLYPGFMVSRGASIRIPSLK